MRILMLGGGGTISGPCAAALRAAGHELRCLTRGQRGPADLAGERGNPAALARAIATVRPDLVIDFLCYGPETARILSDAMAGGPARLVHVGTCDAAGYPLVRVPWSNGDGDNAPLGAYAQAKVAAEAVVRDAHAGGLVAATILRPTYSMGDRFVIGLLQPRIAAIVERLRAGAPIALPDGGHRRLHAGTGTDAGRLIAGLAPQDALAGRTLVVGTPGAAMTQAEYLGRIARAAGCTLRTVAIAGEALTAAVFDEGAESLWHRLTRFDVAFDTSEAAALCPGFAPAADRDAILGRHVAGLAPAAAADRQLEERAAALG
jgi:nucleoside-diphosphate-sugar epimerase